ncbi:hypothetical protein G7054_g13864 [Neopestalotiopsis clavispora]|nr:hypothetical protein G7054_g13864 [Neopestalotiopsis clavispora]
MVAKDDIDSMIFIFAEGGPAAPGVVETIATVVDNITDMPGVCPDHVEKHNKGRHTNQWKEGPGLRHAKRANPLRRSSLPGSFLTLGHENLSVA